MLAQIPVAFVGLFIHFFYWKRKREAEKQKQRDQKKKERKLFEFGVRRGKWKCLNVGRQIGNFGSNMAPPTNININAFAQ